jgi:hypothetical protein
MYRGAAALVAKIRANAADKALPPVEIPSWHPEQLR